MGALRWTVASLATCLLVVTGCGRDFSLPDLGSGSVIRNLEVTPEIVGPGGTLTIAFQAPAGADAHVTVNARPARHALSEGTRQVYAYDVQGDEGEALLVEVRVTTGDGPTTTSRVVRLDNVPPAAPSPLYVHLEANPPGTDDRVLGAPNPAVEDDVEWAVLTLDAEGSTVLARVPVDASGAFGPVGIGDNAVAAVYVFLEDHVGNVSVPLRLENDISPPVLETLVSTPPAPRAGAPFEIRLGFDEPLSEAPGVLLVSSDGAQTTPIEMDRIGAELWAGTTLAPDWTPGALTITVDAADLAGNPASFERALTLLGPGEIDVSRIGMRRILSSEDRWRISAAAGAVPAPGQVEIRDLDDEPLATVEAQPDGSFEDVEIEIADGHLGVVVAARDPGGFLLSAEAVRPNLVPPDLRRVTVLPNPARTGSVVRIDVESDKVLSDETMVAVGDRPAHREGEVLPGVTRFVYTVAGDENDGETPVRIEAIDLDGNTVVRLTDVLLEIQPPEIVLSRPGETNPYQMSEWPPFWSDCSETDHAVLEWYCPPDAFDVLLTEPVSGIATVKYRVTRMRANLAWSGTSWVSPSSASAWHAVPRGDLPVFTVDIPDPVEFERFRVEVMVTSHAGNVGLGDARTSSYAFVSWAWGYPTYLHGSGADVVFGYFSGAAALSDGRVCAGHLEGNPGATSLGVTSTVDGGETWTRAPLLSSGSYADVPNFHVMSFSPDEETGLLAGRNGLFVRLDADCGVVDQTTLAFDVHDVVWETEDDTLVAWLATSDGIYRSVDRGQTLERVPSSPAQVFRGIARHPSGLLLAAGNNGIVARSDDGGASWSVSAPVGALARFNDVVITDGGNIFAGGRLAAGSALLLRSADLGTSWAAIDPVNSWPEGRDVTNMAAVPGGGVMVEGHLFFDSDDWYFAYYIDESGEDWIMVDSALTRPSEPLPVDRYLVWRFGGAEWGIVGGVVRTRAMVFVSPTGGWY